MNINLDKFHMIFEVQAIKELHDRLPIFSRRDWFHHILVSPIAFMLNLIVLVPLPEIRKLIALFSYCRASIVYKGFKKKL